MSRPQRLFDLTVVHGYFADPAGCRLAFVPDAATAAWAARIDGAFRGFGNGFAAYCAADRAPGGDRGPAGQVTLRFGAFPDDPLFGNFTAAGPVDDRHAVPVYELRPDAPVAATALPSQAKGADTGRAAAPAFEVHIEVPATAHAPPSYRIEIAPRAVVWTYLLDAETWRDSNPCIVVPKPGGAQAPVAGPFAAAEPIVLANGRAGLVLKSNDPLPLADRGKRLELWSQRDGGLGRRLLSSLPLPSPANLARSGDAGPATMCEILVPSLK